MTQKVITRFQNPINGEYYYLQGKTEKVAIKLSAPIVVDWQLYKIQVQDITLANSLYIDINENGECVFEIPLGNRYAITLPYIEKYDQPNQLTYTANLSSRNIDYTYGSKYEVLTIRIVVRSELDGNDASMFNGLEAIAKSATNEYKGVIENGQVTIQVPYGTNYSIVMPEFDGLSHNHVNETFVAGLSARNLVYSYVDYNNLHITGLDVDGNVYTIADLQEMGVEAASAKIIAGVYNDATLANAPRKDGGVGCGFAFSVDTTFTGSWASANVDFGINNPVVADAIATGTLTEGCGYYNTHDKAFVVKDGSGESALVMQVGKVLADAGQLNQSNPTPIFKQALDKKLTIAGVERSGFIPTYGQLYPLLLSKNELDLFFETLGKTAPSIQIGNWWTSCQIGATNAVSLNNGNFYVAMVKVSYIPNILCCFDLP